jgi:hypothetical protein
MIWLVDSNPQFWSDHQFALVAFGWHKSDYNVMVYVIIKTLNQLVTEQPGQVLDRIAG